jgi:5-methylcytosine-specific restriction endonuclease McrA
VRAQERTRYAANPARKRRNEQAYRARYPERIYARVRNRKLRVRQAPGRHTGADVLRQREAQGDRCWWCACDVAGGYHVDHLIPLARGGSNGPENIVISCPRCNLSRGAKLPHEFKEAQSEQRS